MGGGRNADKKFSIRKRLPLDSRTHPEGLEGRRNYNILGILGRPAQEETKGGTGTIYCA